VAIDTAKASIANPSEIPSKLSQLIIKTADIPTSLAN
jgi:hypothetical protein